MEKKTKMMQIRIDPALVLEIKRRALNKNITMTVWIIRALLEAIKKEQKYE